MAFSTHRGPKGEHDPHRRSCPLRGDATDCATRHCFIFGIQIEKKQEENRDTVGKQRAISQWQMAKIGIANTSLAKTSEAKSSPCSSACTSSAIARIPTQSGFCLKKKIYLISLRWVYAKSSQCPNVTYHAVLLYREDLIFLSVTVGLPHNLPGPSLEGKQHNFTPLSGSPQHLLMNVSYSICTISDEMVFAKQGHA